MYVCLNVSELSEWWEIWSQLCSADTFVFFLFFTMTGNQLNVLANSVTDAI